MKQNMEDLLLEKLPKNGKKNSDVDVKISPPKFATLQFTIEGTAPLVQARFSKKLELMQKYAEQSKAKKNKEARNYDADFRESYYKCKDWVGVNAASFRAAMIRACSLVNFKMTLAKLSIFIIADGFDDSEGIPLVKIIGTPEPLIMPMRNKSGGTDIRVRTKVWPWAINLKVTYDTDQFNATDVTNLLSRAGAQVGIGEGRPSSRESIGMGWGTFKIV
jgi:hypothetical protein